MLSLGAVGQSSPGGTLEDGAGRWGSAGLTACSRHVPHGHDPLLPHQPLWAEEGKENGGTLAPKYHRMFGVGRDLCGSSSPSPQRADRPHTPCSSKSHAWGCRPRRRLSGCSRPAPARRLGGGTAEASGPCAGGPRGTDKPMFGFVAGRPRGRNAQVPGFQHLRRPPALIGNRASRWCEPGGKGVPGPRPAAPRAPSRRRGLGQPPRDAHPAAAWGRHGAGAGHYSPRGRAPESVQNPPEQGPSSSLLRILPPPPPSPRKMRAPAPASLAGEPGIEQRRRRWRQRNVTLGHRPRPAALLCGARHPVWVQSAGRAGDSKEAPGWSLCSLGCGP